MNSSKTRLTDSLELSESVNKNAAGTQSPASSTAALPSARKTVKMVSEQVDIGSLLRGDVESGIAEQEQLSPNDAVYRLELTEDERIRLAGTNDAELANIPTVLESCPLMHATVITRSYHVMRRLLDRDEQFANQVDESGQFPLHLACRTSDPVSVRLLGPATRPASRVTADRSHGRTPLLWALATGSSACLAELVSVGCFDAAGGLRMPEEPVLPPLDLPDLEGKTALDYLDDYNSSEDSRNANSAAALLKQLVDAESGTLIAQMPVQLRLMRKVCTYRMPEQPLLEASFDNGSASPVCPCGQPADGHELLTTALPSRHTWSRDGDTVELVNNCFGEVEFSGLGNTAQYYRVSQNATDEALMSLLTGHWGLGKPSLIISVYGTEIDKTTFKSVWQKGLWKAAGGSGAWVVTDGYDGLSELSGQAVRDYCDAYGEDSILAIGVSPWGRVANRSSLASETYLGCYPAKYAMESDGGSSSISLDHNHSHFLLPDSGRYGDAAVDDARMFRSRFELLVKEWSAASGPDRAGSSAYLDGAVPICGLLSGGGRHALKGVHASLCRNEVPLVLIKGTGGLADLLAVLIEELLEVEGAKHKKKKNLEREQDILEFNRLRNLMLDIWTLPLGTDLDKEVAALIEILRRKQCIEIFSLDEDAPTDLDAKILASLLNSAGVDSHEESERFNKAQLKIALALDRSDVARQKVFGENKKWRKGDLDAFMREALRDNKVAFVKLFVQQGFSLEQFVTIQLLEDLYTEDVMTGFQTVGILRNGLQAAVGKTGVNRVSLEDIGRVLLHMMGSFYKPFYLSKEFQKEFRIGNSQKSQHGLGFRNSSYVKFSANEMDRRNSDSSSPACMERPVLDLFTWSLLTQRTVLAEFFWSLEKECIAGALFAAMLLREARAFSDDLTEKEQLEALANAFEARAEGVLEECYRDNQSNTQENLVRELPFYGQSTCFVLAAEGGSIKFISHRCCQEMLDLIWKGNLSTKKNGALRFFCGLGCGLVCPPLLALVIKYNADDRDEAGPAGHPDASNNALALVGGGSGVSGVSSFGNRRKSTAAIRPNFKTNKVDPETGDRLPVVRRRRCRCLAPKEFATRILDFYFAPVVRFIYSTLAYLIFLGIYSYVMLFLFDNGIDNWSVIHLLLLVWVVSLGLEEIRQAALSGTSFRSYVSDMWNVMDIVAIALFLIGSCFFIMRSMDSLVQELFLTGTDAAALKNAKETLIRLSRICLCIALFIFYIRILQVFSIHVSLGPKVVMIQNMIVKDLLPFLVIFLLFILAYGIMWSSILFPKSSLSVAEAMSEIINIMKTSYFQVFGELKVDLMAGDGDNCKTNSIGCPDIWGKWLAPILLGVHIVLTNVLLLNLLIATFSHTYEEIQSSSTQHWTLQRYMIMREYTERSPIAPPLIIVWHLVFVLYVLVQRCRGNRVFENGPFKRSYSGNKQRERQLMQWEHIRAVEFLRGLDDPKRKRKSDTRTIVRAGGVGGNAANMKKELDSVQEGLGDLFRDSIREVEVNVKRIDNVERRLEELTEMVANLAKSMGEKHYEMVTIIQHQYEQSDERNRRQAMTLSGGSRGQRLQLADAARRSSPADDDFSVHLGSDDSTEEEQRPRVWLCRLQHHQMARLVPYQLDASAEGPVTWRSTEWPDKEDNIAAGGFNGFDTAAGFHRGSCAGRYQLDNDGRPLNPCGSAGVPDRGRLPLWGPNHCVHLAVTRWKRDDRQNIAKKAGRPVLQAAAVLDRRGGMQLPWFHVKHNLPTCISAASTSASSSASSAGDGSSGQCALQNVLRAWLRDRIDALDASRLSAKRLHIQQEAVTAATFSLVYSGMLNDRVNGDCAWLETSLLNLHEHFNYNFQDDVLTESLREAGSGERIAWIDVANRKLMRQSHNTLLQMVAQQHAAFF